MPPSVLYWKLVQLAKTSAQFLLRERSIMQEKRQTGRRPRSKMGFLPVVKVQMKRKALHHPKKKRTVTGFHHLLNNHLMNLFQVRFKCAIWFTWTVFIKYYAILDTSFECMSISLSRQSWVRNSFDEVYWKCGSLEISWNDRWTFVKLILADRVWWTRYPLSSHIRRSCTLARHPSLGRSIIRASHRPSEGCGFDPRMGLTFYLTLFRYLTLRCLTSPYPILK